MGLPDLRMPHSPEPNDPLEQMLDHLLCAEPRERSLILGELCDANPGQAAMLRRRYTALEQIGMLDVDEPQEPTQIGSYTVVEQIGEGGMGVVYRAHQEGLDRDVAVKLLRPEFAWLATNRQRFQREGRVVARLEHPAIVPILQFGDHDGQPFLVMRHIAGRSLADLIADLVRTALADRTGDSIVRALAKGPDGVDEVAVSSALHGLEARWSRVVARLLLPIAEALGHAHQRGVVHRDVKPSNILISRDGRAFLCDFGLASLADPSFADGEDQLTRTGALLGSVPYMSPEQVEGACADARSDVFSFGSVLYEALLGERAFGIGSQSQTMHAIARTEPTAIGTRRTLIEPDLLAILLRCLEKRPARRYQSGDELATDLRAYLADLPVRARKLTFAHRVVRLARREPVRFALGVTAAAFLLLSASLGGYLWAGRAARATGEQKLQADRVERELALGYLSLFESQPTRAAQHFSRCLQLDTDCRAATTGLAMLREETRPDNLAKQQPASEFTTSADLFAKAAQNIFRGPKGDRSGAQHAARLLQDALLRAPHARLAYHGMLAKAAATAGEHSLAERTADALEQIWPASATAAYCAGYARIEIDAEAAAEAFARATQLDPSLAIAWAELGLARLKQQNAVAAKAALEKAIELDEHNSRTWLNLGLAHQQAGEDAKAETALRHAASLPHAVPGASYNLGVVLAATDVDAAIEAFATTTVLAPDDAEAWCNLGTLRTQTGDHEGGKQALERALRLREDWEHAWRHLGSNRAHAGDARAAAEAYRKVVALAPEDLQAKAYLDSLLRHLQQNDPAPDNDAASPNSTAAHKPTPRKTSGNR